MNNPALRGIIIGILLGAYMVPGILSRENLFGQPLFFKLHSTPSVHVDRSINLDARPYWTSHRHIVSSEKVFSDQILFTIEPWLGAVKLRHRREIKGSFPTLLANSSPHNAFRAPPHS